MRTCMLAAMAAAAVSAACVLPGCGRAVPQRPGTAPNEVLTLREIPEGRAIVTLRGEDGIDFSRIERAVERQFPSVDIIPVNNTPSDLDFEHGRGEDIFLTSFSSEQRTDYVNYLLDLSGQDFTENYYLTALNNCSVDSRLPYLPGPSNIYGIVYDKELFARYGWRVPGNLDEFIELCRTIEATGIRALQPALYYNDAVRQFFAGFTYEQLFGGIDNYNWLKAYQAGGETMAGHVEPGFETMRRLMEAGILRPEDFGVRPAVRTKMMHQQHACAMILETQLAPVYAKLYGKGLEHELGMMPFYSGGEDSDYLLSIPHFYLGVNGALANAGNEEKLQLVLDIVGWISTVEGQQAIIAPESPMISSIKGVPFVAGDFLSDVEQTLSKNHVVPQPFWSGNSNTAIDIAFKEKFAAWSRGEASLPDLFSSCDSARDALLSRQSEELPEAIGTAKADFTVLETSLYLAELFKQEMDAEIGLCLSNSRQCGNNARIYAGVIASSAEEGLSAYLSRCFTTPNVKEFPDRQLIKVSLTGQQIMEILNHPPKQDFYPDNYYAAAGLKIEFAPWAGEGKRCVSVTLADGSPLVPGTDYTVALWNGSVSEEYALKPLATSPFTAAELLAMAVQREGEIAPPNDRRFVLNWDLTDN